VRASVGVHTVLHTLLLPSCTLQPPCLLLVLSKGMHLQECLLRSFNLLILSGQWYKQGLHLTGVKEQAMLSQDCRLLCFPNKVINKATVRAVTKSDGAMIL
jgi:hypothetical protein